MDDQLVKKENHDTVDDDGDGDCEKRLNEMTQNSEKSKKNSLRSKWQLLQWTLFIFVVLALILLLREQMSYEKNNSQSRVTKQESLVENYVIPLRKKVDDLSERLSELTSALIKSSETAKSSHQQDEKETTLKTAGHHVLSCATALARFDCHPEEGASEEHCVHERGCCWDGSAKQGAPSCFYPSGWQLYELSSHNQIDLNFTGDLKLLRNSAYGHDLPLIRMETEPLGDDILRVKIFDPRNKRYEPPYPKAEQKKEQPATSYKSAKYRFEYDVINKQPAFNILRSARSGRITAGAALFRSIGVGGFIFDNQLLQISAVLPSSKIYGLGEHRAPLLRPMDWQVMSFFNADQPPVENANLYGSHPFYMLMEENGDCYGVLFLNSNAMEVVLQPTPGITFRTIGGIFDMYFFMGPSHEDVIRQYSDIVGRPFMPPYWSLGFHLSRFGLKTLGNTIALYERTKNAAIPLDTIWNDLDYMNERNDFTYDPVNFNKITEFIERLHREGAHYIPIIDAGISGYEARGTYPPLDEGLQEGIFVMDPETREPFHGKVWNRNATFWPDYHHPNITHYWLNMLKHTYKAIPYDGIWLDMNEPSNFYNGLEHGCSKNNLDFPPYVPRVQDGLLSHKTICMNAQHHLGPHYNLHNTFGTSQAAITNYALKTIRGNKRPFIISRSTWVGHGYYAGHWSGDNFATWHDMRASISEILTMGFHQIPMIGADICGFNGNTTVELCQRWMQLGAFYPFSRNHNSDDTIEQDPVTLGPAVIDSSIKALKIRYYFLPYLYTLFFRAHKFGETVARPLFFEFVEDARTHAIDTHFMWGKYLLIVPVLQEKVDRVEVYIPRGFWYYYQEKRRFISTGDRVGFEAPLDRIPLLIRGGAVFPLQAPRGTTSASRKQPFHLLVALDHEKQASGELYWDDGDSQDSLLSKKFQHMFFSVTNGTLKSSNLKDGTFDEAMWLEKIEVWGITESVEYVIVNGKFIKTFDYSSNDLILTVTKLKTDLRTDLEMKWSKKKPKMTRGDEFSAETLASSSETVILSRVVMTVLSCLFLLLAF